MDWEHISIFRKIQYQLSVPICCQKPAMPRINVSQNVRRKADANYFTLQINPEAVFEDGNSSGSIEIVNPGTNVYPIAVDITLSNGELVYSSGAIYPNQFVENVNLITPLAKGEYQAKATINIYDPETKEKQGVTEAELTIIVKN